MARSRYVLGRIVYEQVANTVVECSWRELAWMEDETRLQAQGGKRVA